MKILFFVKDYFKYYGGVEENVFNISQILSYDNEVYIAADFVEERNFHFSKKVNYIPTKEIKINDFDVIFIENFNISPHFSLFMRLMFSKKSYNQKVIFVPHGGFCLIDWQSFSFFNRVVKKAYLKIFGLFFINNFTDKIIAVSDYEKNELIKNGIKKEIIVIRNGIEKIQSKKVKKEDYFVFIGRIASVKNLEEIILTFKYIISDKRFLNYRLKIIGGFNYSNNHYYNLLKQLIKTNHLENKVEFLGKKVGKEKFDILTKSKCLFCLSRLENDPVVIKEAFSVRTKVLISNNFGLKDYENENNIFVKYGEDLDMDKFDKFINEDFKKSFKIKLLTWKEVSNEYKNLIRKKIQ